MFEVRMISMRFAFLPALCLAIVSMSLMSCSPADSHEPAPSVARDAVSVDFTVGGMFCDGCANRIAGEIRSIEGVVSCEVSYEDGAAHVLVTDPEIADRITEKIGGIGYSITAREPVVEPAG